MVCKTTYTGANPVRASINTMSSSVGIEVELPWATMLGRVDPEASEILRNSHGFYGLSSSQQARVQTGFHALDLEYKERVERVIDNDKIKPGNDGFKEFAFSPVHEPEELIQSLGALYDNGILMEGETYPLHFTFGGVTRSLAWVSLMSMEICDGLIPDRLTQTRTWARKGTAGILERKPKELEIDSIAVEFRTLQLTSLGQFEKILKVGKSICDSVVENDLDKVFCVRSTLINLLADRDIDASKQWPNPQKNIKPWASMAEALRDSLFRQEMSDEILGII